MTTIERIMASLQRYKGAAATLKAWLTGSAGVNVPDGARIDEMADLVGGVSVVKSVKGAEYLFYNGTRLGNINELLPLVDASGGKMDYMFYGTKAFEGADFRKMKTAGITSMNSAFRSSGIKSIDLSQIDTSAVSSASDLFGYCDSLEEITNFSFPAMTNNPSYFWPSGSLNSMLPLGGYPLRRLTFVQDLPDGKYAINIHINIAGCKFDRDAMAEMFQGLPESVMKHESTYDMNAVKIKISSNPCVVDGTLTDDDRAIAVSKGWTLVE